MQNNKSATAIIQKDICLHKNYSKPYRHKAGCLKTYIKAILCTQKKCRETFKNSVQKSLIY